MARQLDNEPGNALTPSTFAERLSEIARSGGLSVERARSSRARATRHGHAARRRSWQRRTAATRRDTVRTRRCTGVAGARIRRQGDYVRHGRHLHQARGRHGSHEGRHGRRRGGRLCHARDRRTEGTDPCHRRDSHRREHARWPRHQARRRAEERVGQDGRGDQHRCRRAAHPGRRAVVRAAAGRDASRRYRHADRRRQHRARKDHQRPVRDTDDVSSSTFARLPSARAIGAGRCRSSTSTRISCAARSPT